MRIGGGMKSFTSGLISGLSGGFTQQWDKQAQAANQKKKQQLDDYLRVAENPNLPDDQRWRAWKEVEGLLGPGKGKGKAGGQPNPILDRVKGLIFGQKPQGGMTEKNLATGQPAAGTAGSTPGSGFPGSAAPPTPQSLPTGQNPQTGRPSQGTGSAATDPNEPRAQSAPVAPPYQQQLENRLAAAQESGNQFAIQRKERALDTFQEKMAVETGRAEAQAEVARIRADAQQAKSDADLLKQKIKDEDDATLKKELAKQKVEFDKEVKRLTAELADASEKLKAADREALKKTVPGKAAGATNGGGPTPAPPKTEGGWRSSALNEIITDDKPSFGLGKSGDRDAYNAARLELMNELGPDGAAALRAQYKAGNTGLATLVKQRDTVGAFENTFEADLSNARKAADNVPRGAAKVFTNWQQLASANLSDNSNLAKFRVATQTAINQYARLMFSATGGGTSTDTARKDAEALLSTAMAKGAYNGALDQMQLEVKNRTAGLDSEIQRQIGQLSKNAGGGGRGGNQSPAQPAASGGKTGDAAADQYLQSIGHQ